MAQAILKPCPVCEKPATERFAPFCCARCANIDLGRWLGETYRVPGEPLERPIEVNIENQHETE
ncbi:MAG: DNA gyrase inhibitor YacG [Bdellovibrionales bacterium]